ncbi:MAG: hypothetical protein KIT20_13480 [Alphaproteobacteria bacterium]|nr:hypothetical protein [Alphaproteobacteria bacterium]
MRPFRHLLLSLGIALALPALAGCSVGRLEAETPRETRVDLVAFRHPLRFQPGASHLALQEERALADFLKRIGAGYGDQAVLVAPQAAAGNEFLLEGREETLERALGRFGLRLAGTGFSDTPEPGAERFELLVHRHVATPPSCPGYNRSLFDEAAARSLNVLGCANAANLGMMVANPGDLVHGRNPGPADGTFAARQIDRYRRGETSRLPASPGTTSEGSGGR